MENSYYKLDEKLIEKVKEIEKITCTNYDLENNMIKIEALISIMEDLLYSYHYLEDEKEDIEEDLRDNYRPLTASEMGIDYEII